MLAEGLWVRTMGFGGLGFSLTFGGTLRHTFIWRPFDVWMVAPAAERETPKRSLVKQSRGVHMKAVGCVDGTCKRKGDDNSYVYIDRQSEGRCPKIINRKGNADRSPVGRTWCIYKEDSLLSRKAGQGKRDGQNFNQKRSRRESSIESIRIIQGYAKSLQPLCRWENTPKSALGCWCADVIFSCKHMLLFLESTVSCCILRC